MKKKLIIVLLITCFAAAYICAQPAPHHHGPKPSPNSSQLLTPKHPPVHHPSVHHHHPPRRPLPPPRVHVHISRPVTVYRSSSRVYRDPPPVRRDLPVGKIVEYEYVYDCDYECPVKGTVKAIDPESGTLVIDSDGDTLIVSASASTKIFRDNDDPNYNNRTPRGVISIGIGDIHRGDFVGVKVTDKGDVTLSAAIVHVFDLR